MSVGASFEIVKARCWVAVIQTDVRTISSEVSAIGIN